MAGSTDLTFTHAHIFYEHFFFSHSSHILLHATTVTISRLYTLRIHCISKYDMFYV
jgi:hypothetical protein